MKQFIIIIIPTWRTPTKERKLTAEKLWVAYHKGSIKEGETWSNSQALFQGLNMYLYRVQRDTAGSVAFKASVTTIVREAQTRVNRDS